MSSPTTLIRSSSLAGEPAARPYSDGLPPPAAAGEGGFSRLLRREREHFPFQYFKLFVEAPGVGRDAGREDDVVEPRLDERLHLRGDHVWRADHSPLHQRLDGGVALRSQR